MANTAFLLLLLPTTDNKDDCSGLKPLYLIPEVGPITYLVNLRSVVKQKVCCLYLAIIVMYLSVE